MPLSEANSSNGCASGRLYNFRCAQIRPKQSKLRLASQQPFEQCNISEIKSNIMIMNDKQTLGIEPSTMGQKRTYAMQRLGARQWRHSNGRMKSTRSMQISGKSKAICGSRIRRARNTGVNKLAGATKTSSTAASRRHCHDCALAL